MAKTIVALFDTPQDAEMAERAVRAVGFTGDDLELIRDSGYGAGEGYGEMMPQLMGWGVPHDEAVAYAEGLRRGGALLVVSPQDDDATARAIAALEDHAPADLAERSAEWRAAGWTGEPPAPMPEPATTTDADRALGDAAEALRVSNAEAVPPPPPHPGTASPSFQPASATDAARQRLDRDDPERRS